MELILLKNVTNLGALGEVVNVRSGYGRNYLLPGGFAMPATPENLREVEARRAELERQAAEALAGAEQRKTVLEGVTLTIARKAGEEGRLFGSVGTADIVAAAAEAGHALDKSEVRLPEGPLRMLGEFEVTLHLHADIDTTIQVAVVPED